MLAGTQAQATYTFDNANRLTGITQGTASVVFGYDNANRRTSATLPGGMAAAYTYDNASQLTGITYTSGSTTLGTRTYTYDKAGRVSVPGGTLFQSVLPAAVTSATYNLSNRMTARTAAGVTINPTWDANGSLTGDGTRTYTWDSRNRLVTIPSLASFVYDGFGRRSSATRSGTTTTFLYDGWDVAQEQQGGTKNDLVLGLGVDERLARGGATYFTDGLGSTLALASGGAIQTSYGYDPYGVSQATGTASTNTFQFTGRENDGTGLLAYRNRFYNPAWGRFVSEDPIGLAGGINVYAYANENPATFKDPSGKDPLIGLSVGAVLGGVYGGIAAASGACSGVSSIAAGVIAGAATGMAIGAADPSLGAATLAAVGGVASGAGDIAGQVISSALAGKYPLSINYGSTAGAVIGGAISGLGGARASGLASAMLGSEALGTGIGTSMTAGPALLGPLVGGALSDAATSSTSAATAPSKQAAQSCD